LDNSFSAIWKMLEYDLHCSFLLEVAG